MSIGALDASLAYGRLVRAPASPVSAPTPAAAATEAGSFGSMVKGMVADTATTLRAAEQASAQHVAGKGDLIDVTTAIGAAEMALDTVVAVRDRVVSAYSDIMHMQI